ncbi:MAG: trimeric intracellular cation channel family protein [Oscillospiraceae bacterium]|nr:trimeric intracellular cation channel family protein [Oscillospiraceae bacterium]
MDTFIFIIEIIGTVAFSLSGAITGINRRYDLFGVVFLGFVTAVGGGILRDLLIGVTPPACFQTPTYMLVAVISALVFFIPAVRRFALRSQSIFDLLLFLMDTAGLAAFTVVGVRAAMNVSAEFGAPLLAAVGTLTGVGGGVMRDILANRRPYIFVKHIYATASVIGSVVYIALCRAGVNDYAAILLSIAVICLIRILSARFRWNLPHPDTTFEDN